MCRAIFSDNSAPVQRENNRSALQRCIVYYLIKCPLQECAVYSGNRPEAAEGKSACKCNGMLFSYSDIGREIEKSLGARAVQVLNQHIRDFVAMSLERMGTRIELFPMVSTGDGAILAFDDAVVAVRFA